MPNPIPKSVLDPTHKVKVSISISPSMLEKVDARAEELDLSRSTVIQFALRHYLDWVDSSE